MIILFIPYPLTKFIHYLNIKLITNMNKKNEEDKSK